MDYPAWIGAGAAILGVGGGLWGALEARLSRVSRTVHERMDREVAQLKELLEAEAEERRRDVNRIDEALEKFAEVQTTVADLDRNVAALTERFTAGTTLIGERVANMAERFSDFKGSNDRAIDELKHSVRSVQTQVQALSVDAASRRSLAGVK